MGRVVAISRDTRILSIATVHAGVRFRAKKPRAAARMRPCRGRPGDYGGSAPPMKGHQDDHYGRSHTAGGGLGHSAIKPTISPLSRFSRSMLTACPFFASVLNN
jgi:hypothetical protein